MSTFHLHARPLHDANVPCMTGCLSCKTCMTSLFIFLSRSLQTATFPQGSLLVSFQTPSPCLHALQDSSFSPGFIISISPCALFNPASSQSSLPPSLLLYNMFLYLANIHMDNIQAVSAAGERKAQGASDSYFDRNEVYGKLVVAPSTLAKGSTLKRHQQEDMNGIEAPLLVNLRPSGNSVSDLHSPLVVYTFTTPPVYSS